MYRPPPLCLAPEQIWDIPASAKTAIGPEIVAATSCSLLLIDLDDWNSFRTAKRWHSSIMEGERVKDALTGLRAEVVAASFLFQFVQTRLKPQYRRLIFTVRDTVVLIAFLGQGQYLTHIVQIIIYVENLDPNLPL